MTCIDITTQAELDAALANKTTSCVHIKSKRGVWLMLADNHDHTVEAFDSATVEAFDSATVRASGSATVRASGSATVRAFGSATVEASDSATVRAFDSATVRAFDSATVRASGSATVEAFDSATVRAFGSATVEASDSATVRAFDSATVRAFGSATVEAFGSATVRAFGSAGVHAHSWSKVTASAHVAVHLHDATATVSGGVLIDVSSLDLKDPQTWADHNGVELRDGQVVLYKALGDDLAAGRRYGRPTVYAVGETVTCEDWASNNDCGGGLHLSPTPHQASTYADAPTRWLECETPLVDLRPISSGSDAKAKCRSLRVVAEVDQFARPLTPAAA